MTRRSAEEASAKYPRYERLDTLRTSRRGGHLVDKQLVAREAVLVIPVVDDNSVVVPLGGRSVADVDLGGDLPFGLVYPPDVDDDVLVVRPVLLVLPSDGRLAVQRRVGRPA